ncbi:MAG: T9SS type A sorting domain-containing protein [Bacteroidales bacterium]|nr:T9SS type A sorting domain-containing protein [Bacteroidales bacterium]
MTRIFKYCAAVVCAFFLSISVQTATVKAQNATFVVSGIAVPDSILSVVEFCTDVWSNYVYSDVPINVSVSWLELPSNINAYAEATNYFLIDGILYQVALAEKIQNKNLNGTAADIEVTINKTLNWSVNTDENPDLGDNKFDLATTILHELAHGLGLSGDIQETTGDKIDSPVIYDFFVCDSTMKKILTKDGDSYRLNTNVLRSDSLFWDGQYAKAFCGEYLELYAPKTFNSGSTVYHLDEKAYPKGSGFELMTPMLTRTEIFRKPDIATVAMLADIGWNDYFIQHAAPQNSSDLESKTTISFSLIDKYLQTENQKIVYSFDGGRHVAYVDAIYNNESNTFTAEIPAMQFEHTVSYKIRFITSNNDTVFFPNQYANEYLSVFVGDDVESPTIEHDPLKIVKATVGNATADIVFTADISDNFEIDSAYVKYYFSTNPNETKTLKFANLVDCRVVLSFPSDANYSEGDYLYYIIGAVDKAGNAIYSNDSVYYQVPFEYPLEPVRYLITDFDDAEMDNYFRLDKFTISKENGFENKALHTAHPYEYSGSASKYIQYTATIKQPIVIASNPATMTFDEVVLVEPGKAGIQYGTFGFWDYVVVEGSKDEENWYPLGKKGWDSQLWDDWKQLYHSQKKNDGKNENSLAVGDASYFKKHTINLLENKYFRAGDTIFVRFRLQSDETNYAWGWAIDNLKIQERIALPIIPLAPSSVTIYPNPCTDRLFVSDNQIRSIEIVDVTGSVKLTASTSPVNVSALTQGVYLAKIMLSSGEVRTQKFVKK